MPKITVTTSWDDGHKLDLRVAELLKAYNLKGTFYISPQDAEIEESQRLSREEIKQISSDFEIGAHTMTHPSLTKISLDSVEAEIGSSQRYLEKVTGKQILSFCYPRGKFDTDHKRVLEKLGFKFARTVRRFFTRLPVDQFAVPTTVHAYRHWSDAFLILKNVGITQFFGCYLNWDELAMRLFDKVLEQGGVFHLWGHSWEIENNDDWKRLGTVLKYISNREGVDYAVNGELYGN